VSTPGSMAMAQERTNCHKRKTVHCFTKSSTVDLWTWRWLLSINSLFRSIGLDF